MPASEPNDRDDSLFRETLERNRARARNLAGLTAASVGAVVAGLVLSPGSEHLTRSARWLGVVAVGLLMVSLGYFGYAQIVRKRDAGERKPDPPKTAEDRVLDSVIKRTRDGAVIGAIALVLLFVMVLTGAVSLEHERTIRVYITPSAAQRVAVACPKIRTSFVARVATREFQELGSSVPVKVSGKACGVQGRGTRTLFLRSAEIVGWHVSRP